MKKLPLLLVLSLIPIAVIYYISTQSQSGANSQDLRTYDLRVSIEGKRFQGGAPDFKSLHQPHLQEFRMAGKVQVRKDWNEDHGILHLQMQQGDTVFVENSNSVPELAQTIKKLFEQGIEAELSADGSITSLRLPEGTATNLSTLVWKIMDIFVVAPRSAGNTTRRIENRMGGRMNVQYQWSENGKVERSILELFPLKDNQDQVIRRLVKTSSANCEYPESERNLPQKCQSSLVTEDHYADQVLSHNTDSIQLIPINNSDLDGTTLETPSNSYQVSLDPKEQHRVNKLDLARNTLGEETLPTLISFMKDQDLDLEIMSAGEISMWSEKMRALLIVHPEKAREFAQTISDHMPTSRAFALVPHILAVAGTPESQHELIQLMDQYADQKQAKWHIITQFNQIDEPTKDTLQFVSSWVDNEQDPDYRDISILALGSLAGASQNDPAGKDVLNKLADQAANATSEGELKIILGALGNAGWEGSLEVANKYLTSHSEDLRMEAIQMLRFVRSDYALQLIKEAAEKDVSEKVRERAVRMLGFRAPDVSTTEFSCALYPRETSSSVRHMHLQNLITWKRQSPCVASTIQQAAQTETDPELIKYVRLLKLQL
jgi:hypothetical protein